MITIEGKYNKVNAFVDELDAQATGVVQKFCDTPYFEYCKMALMPDAHAGKGCPIGTVMRSKNIIIPAFTGVDIGCRVVSAIIKKGKKKLNLDQFDKVVRSNPSDHYKQKRLESFKKCADDSKVPGYKFINPTNVDSLYEVAFNQLGTVGGGNHFIELGEYDEDHYVLTVHSGSRGFGARVAKFYQDLAFKTCTENGICIPYEFAFFDLFEDPRPFIGYMMDMTEAMLYAWKNVYSIIDNIISRASKFFDINDMKTIDNPHNYVFVDSDAGQYVTLKGSVSTAGDVKHAIVPLNMRDGVLIGKYNDTLDERWLGGFPHGAGRQYSRVETLNRVTLNGLKKEMEGIYTSCLSKNILDEAPIAYKPTDHILPKISDKLSDIHICKPIYNYKVSG